MSNQKLTIVLFAAMVLSGWASVRGAVRLGGDGFRFQMVPVDPGGHSSHRVAAANCAIRINRRDVLLHWTTTPFSHVEDSQVISDAFLSATVVRELGQVSVTPRRVIERTDVADNDRTASVAMGVRGDGQLDIRMEVGIENRFAPAGRHCANVVLTVTGL